MKDKKFKELPQIKGHHVGWILEQEKKLLPYLLYLLWILMQ